MQRYLELFNLSKTFTTPKGPLTVVEEFNLIVEEGQFVGLIGHSGCGKSTVLAMVAGLSQPSQGSITLAGRELDGPGPDRGVVFQSPSLLPWMTAFENVMTAVEQAMPRASREEIHEVTRENLHRVGLADAMHRRPAQLSQGMQQRVGIARALALNPKMLLLDEPFGMLDSLTRMDLQQVLLDVWGQNRKTALMVTHDVDEALYVCDRIVMMTNGPHAKVGAILDVTFPRPRKREQLLEDPGYYRLREQLISFLEEQEHAKHAVAV